jgi:vancomycin aglycone glucosyltransferase
MLALSRHLVASGHLVRLCAPPDFEIEVREAGAEFISLGTNVREFIEEKADALHGRGLRMMAAMKAWGEVSLENQFRILPQAVRGCDYVLAAGTILAASSAAELEGIPFRFIAYTPGLLPSREHTPVMLPFQVRSHLANRALWWLTTMLLNAVVKRELTRKRHSISRRLATQSHTSFRSGR